jgi:hypothetical protein
MSLCKHPSHALNAEGQSASFRISPQGEVAGAAELFWRAAASLWSRCGRKLSICGTGPLLFGVAGKREGGRSPPAIFSWNWRSPRQSREERQLLS